MKLNKVIAFTGKRKKLKKLAKKLSLRKSREADHKIERKRFGSGIGPRTTLVELLRKNRVI